MIQNGKMYIYIDGKTPVARKSKSLNEMGVKDGDTLVVTTEMKLPLEEHSEFEDDHPFEPNGNMMFGQQQIEEQYPQAINTQQSKPN